MPNKFQFLEKDFASSMESLETEILQTENWKDLLFYRGISTLDAGYFDFYREFYNVFHRQTNPEVMAQGAFEKNTKNWLLRFREKINSETLVWYFKKKLIYPIIMSLPPKAIPKTNGKNRALVVRSYSNTSPFPVLKQLADEPDWDVLFASWNPRLAKFVAKIGIPFLQLDETYRKVYTNSLKQHTSEVKQLIHQVDTNLLVQILTESLRIPISYEPRIFLEQEIVKIRAYTDIYFDLLEKYQPSIVILLNEISLLDRLMGLVCTFAGIPSISIQHGLFIGYAYHKLATDKVIVWGEEPKLFWEQAGCAPERVVSVGALGHEKWAALNTSNSQVSQVGRPQILFLGQNPAAFITHETHSKTVQAVFRAIKMLPEYDFVVKPHPAENSDPYYQAYQDHSTISNGEIITDGAVEDAILSSDLVITVFSTAGLEAMLLGKPVIVLNLSQEPSIAPYVSAAKLVETENSLPKEIINILEDQNLRHSLINAGSEYAKSYLGEMDGQSVRRAVQAIINLSQDKLM